jgi:hypothetical protein
MDEDKKTKVILPASGNFILKVIAFLNRFLVFMQLRPKKRYWGIVYDSVSKQPLDPVKVSLIYVDTGKVEGMGITDMEGRYGFFARPGRFKIFVQRTNYVFPSSLVSGDTDGVYSNLYHGEFFDLEEESEVIAPNIPMDPVRSDWNQEAKKGMIKKSFYSQWFAEKLLKIVFWFIFIYISIVLFFNGFDPGFLRILFFIYLALFALQGLIPPFRLWGEVVDQTTGRPISGLALKLTNPRVPGVNFGSATSRQDGKFFLRGNPAYYVLKLVDSETNKELGEFPIEIGAEGVFNAKIVVKDFF